MDGPDLLQRDHAGPPLDWLGEDHATFWSQRRDAKLYYHALIELSGQIPFLADGHGKILTIAAQWQELTGITVQQALQFGIARAIFPDDAERMTTAWWEAIRAGGRFDEHCRLRRADGRYGWVRVRGCQLQHDDGDVTWLGAIEDTDTQHRLYAKALAAEERYRLAARATHDLIWDHDLATDRLRMSASAAATLGIKPPSDFVSVDWAGSQVHPADQAFARESYRIALESAQEVWLCDYRLRRGDGYVVVSNCAFIARNEAGRAVRVVGAVRDRTAELKLEELQAELFRVSQISEMGAMAAMLAHELNQPLTAVTGYIRGAQRLLRQGTDDAVERSIEAMNAAAETALAAGAIVRRLRDLVTRNDASAAVHDLADIVEQACTMALAGASQWRIDRQIDLDPAARKVAVDSVQISQVMVNLLRNAVAAMRQVSYRRITIRAWVKGECAEICIGDTGGGMTAEQQARLFQPFSSTSTEGMGIGLALCRMMVEANGGHIWLGKSDRHGTDFRFTVPLADWKD